jgi:hypothetical protein
MDQDNWDREVQRAGQPQVLVNNPEPKDTSWDWPTTIALLGVLAFIWATLWLFFG